MKLVEDPAFELFRHAIVVNFSGKSRRIKLFFFICGKVQQLRTYNIF